MKGLSSLFFCLSPFVLFCSEDGNGLILCPVFIILGFVFKILGNKPKKISYTDSNGEQKTYKIKKDKHGNEKVIFEVPSHKFWEWHYKDRIRGTLAEKDSISDDLMAYRDREARRWATTICGYHNAWVPPNDTQEQIARANGVITEQLAKERKEKKDRIQIGKYFLMTELMEKYHLTKIGKGGREKCCYPELTIEKDRYKIKTSDYRPISEYWVKSEYNKTIQETWDNLSEEEKNRVTKWIEEYEKKLMEQVNEYVYGDLYPINVKMDF